jgi:hypothetical protein
MRRLILFVVLDLFLFALAASAQTIAPPTAEFNTKPGKTSRGSFQTQNNSLQAVAFTIESYSVTVDARGPQYHPLDPGVKVELSSTSGRLGPKQIFTTDYRISCDSLPCAVAIKTGMVTGHTKDGMQVRIILSHFAYLAQSKHPRQDILMAAGLMQKR